MINGFGQLRLAALYEQGETIVLNGVVTQANRKNHELQEASAWKPKG